jgi:hypothetical protein
MSAVVEAVRGVVDFVGDVVQSVLDDPLTAIATAAAASFGIPIIGLKAGAVAAGVANTAAGLVQGEDFGEALKGGVTAGAATWAGGQLFGSTADDAAAAAAKASAVDDAASLNASSSYGSAAAKTSGQLADETIAATGSTYYTPSTFNVAKNLSGSADDTLAANLNASSLSTTGDDFLNASMAGGDGLPIKMLDADEFSSAASGNATGYAGKNLSQFADDAATAGGSVAKEAAGEVIEGAGNVTHGSSYTGSYRPSYDIGKNLGQVADDSGTLLGLKNPYAPKVDAFSQTVDDTIAAGASKPYNIVDAAKGELGSYYDTAAGYIGDAWKFAKTYPILTAGGALLAANVLGDKPDGEDDTGIDDRKKERDERFNRPLEQLEFDRQARQYKDLEDYYNYGAGPEHEFFTPGVYKPVEYADGGQVAQQPSKVNPAFAFYRYGAVPDSVKRYGDGGYASGGNPRHGQSDGRSDDIQALLSPGEFVIDAETVSLLGNGSSDAGARRLEEMRSAVRKQKGGALSKGKFSPNAKSPLSYMKRKG